MSADAMPSPDAPRHPVSRTRRSSIADVARRAGVSHQTVSRVVNGGPSVRESTRSAVMTAVQELDYRPNRVARALATGRSRLVGVIATGRDRSGPSRTLQGIEEVAAEQGYATAVVSLADLAHLTISAAADQLLGVGVDGIVIIASAVPDQVRSIGNHWPVPVVVVQGPTLSETSAFCSDDSDGAAAAVRHLLGLGHRRVWHVAGPDGWWDTTQRLAGWRRELLQAGIEPPPVRHGDWTARTGYHHGIALAEDSDVTAVFVANDEMAAGLITAFRRAGRPCPEHVSVVGFDDDALSEYLDPPLTTLRSDHRHRGRTAVTTLLHRLEFRDESVDEPIDLGIPLVVRASTGSPRRPG